VGVKKTGRRYGTQKRVWVLDYKDMKEEEEEERRRSLDAMM
jgi:hypothetical protein